MRCKGCNGSNFQRDEVTGNSFCCGCGTLQEYDNYEAQLGGIKGPEGTFVRVGTIGTGSVLAYKEKKIYEANKLIEDITERLNLGNKSEAIKSMISKITDGEFGQGEWFPILIGACCYALVRNEGKGVLPMEEIADAVGCDLHQLGSLIKRVVDHLELELREFDLVGLFMKTANSSRRLSDVDREKKERITQQGAFLMNCALKWFLSTGRKPMPLVVAVLVFVVQVNGVKVKIDDFAKDARISLTTCKTRYKELSERLVKVAEEVSLPWAKDVTVKNVVKHSGTLISLMEAKSLRKRKQGTGVELVRTGGFCLEDIVRDCLSNKSMYCYDDDDDDHQDALSQYFDVGDERQLNLCNKDDIRGESQLSICNNDDNISAKQLSMKYNEIVDGVCGGILAEKCQRSNNSLWQRRPVFDMASSEHLWKGTSVLSQRLLLKDLLKKDVGLDAFPPSYIKGCVEVERRREKIKAAKLRINAIHHPSEIVSKGAFSLELEHSKKKRKKKTETDWEDLVIQTLVLHNVNEEEIEKGLELAVQTGKHNRLQSNPGYIFCITCPRHLHEFSFEPSKTHVEFKNWEPILSFIRRIILANWKKNTSLELLDGSAYLLAKGDRQDLRRQEDWPEVMEPTKKKLKRSNDQPHRSFLLSPAAGLKRDSDYLSEGKDEWSVQYEFDMNIENLKEQDTVAEFDCQTNSLPQSRDIDFQQVTELLETSFVAGDTWNTKSLKRSQTSTLLNTCNTKSLKRCQNSTPLNFDHDFTKDSDELNFQFGESKDELNVSNFTGKHLLRGCSSRGSLALNEPIQTHDEGSGSFMSLILKNDRSNSLIGVLETREGGGHSDIFSDTLEFHGMTRTLDCSLKSSWRETDWFTPQRSSYSGCARIEEDFNEDKIFRKTYFSSVNVENSGAENFCLSSELSPMYSTPPFATKWETDYQKGCQILEGSLRLGRMPYPEYLFSAANNIKFDHEVIPQMDCRETNTDSFTDIQNCTQSDEKVCKSLWGHSDNVGTEQFSNRKDKFSYRDVRQNNVCKQRSRRSRSAPPFYRDKRRFISLNCRSDTKSKNSDLSEHDDLECLTQPCSTSHLHPKRSIIDDVSYDHIQETEKILSFASDLKASAGCRNVHSETQDEHGDKDFGPEENVDLGKSTTKWRHNCSASQVAKESHELHDHDKVLDICSGLLHLRSDESLVPESINRHSLDNAKVLHQVDKKYIPIVACGTVAIVDQHAADERIRLEELRKKVLAGEARTVTYLSADKELVLPEMGYQLLQSYSEQIRNWGWICNINVEGSTPFKKNMSIIQRKPTPITLNAVPCILGVNLSDVDLLEFLQQLVDTDGSSTIPPSVLRVLNSKACRGAIMFGDSLLPSECSLIIEGLKQTSLCFQCAHGRPTTVPLVNLKALHKQIATLGGSQLWHGFQRREITLDCAKSRLDKAKS